jgi:hypothetical protein
MTGTDEPIEKENRSMRTLTAIALATAMLFTVANANATTHKKKKHHAQASQKTEKAPKAETKAPEKAPK